MADQSRLADGQTPQPIFFVWDTRTKKARDHTQAIFFLNWVKSAL
jgi:hypothetical protein